MGYLAIATAIWRYVVVTPTRTIAIAMTAMMEVLKDDPLFQTGYPRVDASLAFSLYAVLLIASYSVLRQLLSSWDTACKAEKKYRRKHAKNQARDHDPSRQKFHWRTIKLLLISAAIIIIFVNTLRFRHRSIKLTSFKLAQDLRSTRNTLKSTSDVSDYFPDANDTKLKAYKYAYGKLPDWLVKQIPWLPHDWSRNASVWSYFRLLIDESRRNWWTRQWAMGWSAWAVFVVIETVNRDHSAMVTAGYILLGYCTSLAGMQFVFFAQLLLDPRLTLKEDNESAAEFWVPGKFWVLAMAAIEALCLVVMPTLLQWMSNASSEAASIWSVVFGIFQLILILAPLATAISDEIGIDYQSAAIARKTLSQAWCILSFLSAALHIWTSIMAFRETNPAGFLGRHSRWGQLGWLIPWRNEHYLSDDISSTSWRVLEELGDHPWINALAWDVLFSILGLCIWSVISSANVRDMLQCTFMPWLDDIADAMEDTINSVQHDVDKVASRAGSLAQDVRQGAGDLFEQAEELAEPAVQNIRQASRSISDKVEPIVGSVADKVLASFAREPDLPKRPGRPRSPVKRSLRAVPSVEDDKAADEPQETRRGSSRGGAREAGQRSTSASHQHKADLRRSARFTNQRQRPGLRGGYDGSGERHDSLSSVASEVIEAAAEAEAAGVTWALFVIGGLGMASAGVYGADQM